MVLYGRIILWVALQKGAIGPNDFVSCDHMNPLCPRVMRSREPDERHASIAALFTTPLPMHYDPSTQALPSPVSFFGANSVKAGSDLVSSGF